MQTLHKRLLAALLGGALMVSFGLGIAVAAPPVAANDSYTADGNVGLSIAAGSGLFANDSGFTRLAAYDARSARGGTVLVNNDGSFSYTPPTGFSGIDRFTYAIENAEGPSQATVTITVGSVTWFVDDSAAAGGDGSYARPFNSFAPLNNSASDVDRAGERIFVYAGTYAALSFTLEAQQTLIGEAAGLSLTTLPIPAGTHPQLSGAANVLVLASGTTVRGLQVASSSAGGSAAISGSNIAGATLDNLIVPGGSGTASGIVINGLTAPLTISDSQISGSYGSAANVAALNLTSIADGATVAINNTPITVSGGRAMRLNSLAEDVTFDSASDITQSAGVGFDIDFVPADGGSNATVIFAGVDLTVTTAPAIDIASGNTSGILVFAEGMTLSGGGYVGSSHTLRVSGTANTINAGANPAITLGNASLDEGVTFASVSATPSGTSTGISLNSSFGTLTINSGSINSSSSGANISINGGFISLGYGGSVSKTSGSGPLISITGAHAFGNVSLSGALNATVGDGILLDNADGAYTFSGVTTLNGENARVRIQNGSGGSANFTNAASSIVNPSGTAFEINASSATGTFAGAITKATTGGHAVDISTLTGTGSYSFNSVTAGNASSGVRINNAAKNITFTTLNLGTSGARFTAIPLDLSGNSATVNLGTVGIFTSGATGLSYTATAAGTIASAGGTINAINAAAVSIAPSSGTQTLGMVLTSVNASNSTFGVNLSGTNGSFAINGDGGTNTTSGGTISTMSEAGVRLFGATNVSIQRMTFTNANTANNDSCNATFTECNGAIKINAATNLLLNRLAITTTADNGISGTGVNGLTLTNVTITSAGNTAGRHGILFAKSNLGTEQNLVGTVSIDNLTITQPAQDAIRIVNYASSLNLTIQNSTLRDTFNRLNNSGAGILLRSLGINQTTATIQDNTLDGINGNPFDVAIESTGTGRVDLLRNTVEDSAAVAGTVRPFRVFNLRAGTSSTTSINATYNVIDNVVTVASDGQTFDMGIFGNNTTFVGRVIGNNLGAGMSGTNSGSTIYVNAEGNVTATTMNAQVKIKNNIVGPANNLDGITVFTQQAIGGSGLDVAVQGNTVAAPAGIGSTRAGLFIGAYETSIVCAVVNQNNTFNAGSTEAVVLLSEGGAFRIEGPASASTTDIESYINANNTLNPANSALAVDSTAFTIANCSADSLSDTP